MKYQPLFPCRYPRLGRAHNNADFISLFALKAMLLGRQHKRSRWRSRVSFRMFRHLRLGSVLLHLHTCDSCRNQSQRTEGGLCEWQKGSWRRSKGRCRQQSCLPPGRPGSTVHKIGSALAGLFVVLGLSSLLVGKLILREGVLD